MASVVETAVGVFVPVRTANEGGGLLLRSVGEHCERGWIHADPRDGDTHLPPIGYRLFSVLWHTAGAVLSFSVLGF